MEQRIDGGMSRVWKNGDAVLRERREYSPTVERLLLHLRAKGFDKAPAFLGVDEQGRQALSFMPGVCPDDWPGDAGRDAHLAVMTKLGSMLRAYHDATLDFKQTDDDIWMLEYPGTFPKEVICHNDFAPYNITFENGLPAGMIDFDTCCPAPRVWDIAYALYRFVPLTQACPNGDGAYVRAFFDAYGMAMPGDMPQIAAQRLTALADYIAKRASEGDAAFIRMLSEGDRQLYLDDAAYILDNAEKWFA